MWLLDKNTKSLRAKTTVAPTTDLSFNFVYETKTPKPETNGLSYPGSGTIDENYSTIITAPNGDSVKKNITYLQVYNTDSINHEVTFSLYDGDVYFLVYSCVLQPKWTVEWSEDERWVVYDEKGIKKKNEEFSIKDGPNLDAFARFRTSTPTTLFDSKQISDSQSLFWDDQQVSGSGTSTTHVTNNALTQISVSDLTAGKRVRQTFRRFNYQPGKSHLIIMTSVFGPSQSGIIKRIGLFDDNNGLFFGQSGSGIGVGIRTFTSGSVVDTNILQDDWNLDKMNGYGASGIDIDFEKSQIFLIDFEWLGVGRIRFGFVINGKIIYCHEVRNSNQLPTVYMSTPNLPLRYEIQNSGSGVASNLKHICSTVISEGGVEENGFNRLITRNVTSLQTAVSTNLYPLIAIRLKSDYLGSTVKLSRITIVCSSSSTYQWKLILNPTITGTPLSFTSLANSSIEYDVSATNASVVTGGTEVDGGYAVQSNEGGVVIPSPNDLVIGSKIDGTRDVLVLAIGAVVGALETFYGSATIKDQQ